MPFAYSRLARSAWGKRQDLIRDRSALLLPNTSPNMLRSGTRRSIWLGAVIAPLAAPLTLATIGFGSDLFRRGSSALDGWQGSLMLVVLAGLPIAYLIMFLLGVPYILWLQRRGCLGWLSVCWGAAIVGGIGMPLAIRLLFSSAQPYATNVVTGAAVGLLCGVAWCATTGPISSTGPTLRHGAE